MNVENAVRIVKVFVSSPVDVAPERGRAQAVAAKLNRDYEGFVRFDTVLWEEHFYKADRSFQPQIPEAVACDVLISIFWTRVGTELPADFARMPNGKPYPSGTAYELLTALAASKAKGIPDVYVFRKIADAMLPTADLERRRQAQTQLDALEAFWSEWFKSEQGHFKAAFQTFGNTDDFERQIEELLRQWLESQHLLGPRLKWPKERGSPFPGLAPFEAEHAAVFFGRDRAIDEARPRLVAAANSGTPFLLIVGASGSGKSSLARAGLIPRLTTPGIVAGIDLWCAALMKPSEGQDGPVASLATALYAALPELAQGDFPTAGALADNLRRGGAAAARPIVGALPRLAGAAQRERRSDQPLRPALVLLVDQLEELFAQTARDDERVSFAEAIRELVTTGQVWCIATLRADLYELLLKQPVLKSLKETGASLDLGPPGPAELAEIVRASAAAAGLVFENNSQKGALDDRLLADAKTADSLPLLQFTLRQLYERRVEANGETRLTHAAYEALGGLQGAIAAEAERAVANLPAGTLDALPRLLRQLAELARDGKTLTLRDVAQTDVMAEPTEAALVGALLGARILIARQDAAGRPTLRLAHDAVLTSWSKAEAAAQASREFYRIRAEVEDALRRWQGRGQSKDRLIQSGVPLAEAEKLVADFARELSPELIGFIGVSRNQARARQRLVAASAVFFFVLAVIATGAGIWAYRERELAETNLDVAVNTANALVTNVAERLRPLAGMSSETVRDILKTAEGAFDQLAASAPSSPQVQWRRANMLLSFADTYMSLGDNTEALRRARTAEEIMATLTKMNPSDDRWQMTLAESHRWSGDVLRAQGNLAGALAEYRSSLEIRERVVARHPENVALRAVLGLGHGRLGYLLADLGQPAAALVQFRAALAIREQLDAQGQLNPGDRRNISIGHRDCGDMLSRQGDVEGALAEYRTSLAVAARLAEENRDNTLLQWDIAALHGRMGLILFAKRDPTKALVEFRLAMDIMKKVTAGDADNVQKTHDLAVFQQNIGDALVAQGNLPDALNSYRDSLAIRQRLIAINGGNTQWQKELNYTIGQIGGLAFRLVLAHNFATALQAAEQASSLAPDRIWLYTNRAHALMFLGHIDEARALYLKYRGEKNVQDGKSWPTLILEDFAQLRKAGLTNPLMDEIEKDFASAG